MTRAVVTAVGQRIHIYPDRVMPSARELPPGTMVTLKGGFPARNEALSVRRGRRGAAPIRRDGELLRTDQKQRDRYDLRVLTFGTYNYWDGLEVAELFNQRGAK